MTHDCRRCRLDQGRWTSFGTVSCPWLRTTFFRAQARLERRGSTRRSSWDVYFTILTDDFAETPLLVARIMRDGRTDLFATGVYLDLIRAEFGRLCLAERHVICDIRQEDPLPVRGTESSIRHRKNASRCRPSTNMAARAIIISGM